MRCQRAHSLSMPSVKHLLENKSGRWHKALSMAFSRTPICAAEGVWGGGGWGYGVIRILSCGGEGGET